MRNVYLSNILTRKVYVNHRPVEGITKEKIQEAFRTLGENNQGLSVRTLTNFLKEKGSEK